MRAVTKRLIIMSFNLYLSESRGGRPYVQHDVQSFREKVFSEGTRKLMSAINLYCFSLTFHGTICCVVWQNLFIRLAKIT